jgi:hypothetical protein
MKEYPINQFFVCDKFYLVFYETLEDAELVYMSAAGSVCCENFEIGKLDLSAGYRPHVMACEEDWISGCRAYWYASTKVKLSFLPPNELIYLLNIVSPIKTSEKYWHVIIGEKIGYIIVDDWLEIKQLRKHE